MKKLVVALLAAFLMAAGLTTVAGGPVHAATSNSCKKYGTCPKPPPPPHKTPKAHAGGTGWMRLGNPRHLGGKMRIVIVDPRGHKRVIIRWTFHKNVSVKLPKLKAGKYRVWVFFYPNGNYRPVYPKFSFNVRR